MSAEGEVAKGWVNIQINERTYTVPEHLPWMLQCIIHERLRQEAKWGEQNHDPALWNLIITEELGESAREALEMHFKGQKSGSLSENYHAELTQVAASAVAAMECNLRRFLI